MVEQLELPVRTPAPAADLAERLGELISLLRGRGWMTRKRLEAEGFRERELRNLVQHDAAGDVLSYPGSPGYKLFGEATMEEIEHAATLRSQAREMLRRYFKYQRRKHKGRA